MQSGMRNLAHCIVFIAWFFPRCLALLYPGVYSYDVWVHIGYVKGILSQNHIPLLNPYEYWYYCTPFLHLSTIVIHNFMGLSIIDSFRLFAIILTIVGFFAFYSLFRGILGTNWRSFIAMMLFSLDFDVITQTNSAIPENLALVFLALMLLLVVKLVGFSNKRGELFIAIFIIVFSLVFTHHLTTYFGLLFALSLFVASVLSKNSAERRVSIVISSMLIVSLIVLPIITNPFMAALYGGYFYLVIVCFSALFFICTIFFLKRELIWQWLNKLRSNNAKRLFVILACFAGLGFFLVTLLFYPYNRPVLWVILKFGLFSCLLGLSIAVFPLLPWSNNKTWIFGLFLGISVLTMGISFIYTTVRTFRFAGFGSVRWEAAVSHRHLAFMLIPFAVMSSIALHKLLLHHRKRRNSHHRMILPGITLLLLVFSASGIVNLYAPVGGWYPEWFSHSEIDAALWLGNAAGNKVFVITDLRLSRLMAGMFPMGFSQLRFLQLNQMILANTTLIFDDPRSHQRSIYFMTSELMETHFMLEKFVVPPIILECSDILDAENSIARIYANSYANIYWKIN